MPRRNHPSRPPRRIVARRKRKPIERYQLDTVALAAALVATGKASALILDDRRKPTTGGRP